MLPVLTFLPASRFTRYGAILQQERLNTEIGRQQFQCKSGAYCRPFQLELHETDNESCIHTIKQHCMSVDYFSCTGYLKRSFYACFLADFKVMFQPHRLNSLQCSKQQVEISK